MRKQMAPFRARGEKSACRFVGVLTFNDRGSQFWIWRGVDDESEVPATARIRQRGDQRDRWGRYRLRFALGADATRLSKLRAESSRAPAALLTSRRPISGSQASTLVAGPLLRALSSSITGSSRSPDLAARLCELPTPCKRLVANHFRSVDPCALRREGRGDGQVFYRIDFVPMWAKMRTRRPNFEPQQLT
jgi:hypothetical protein